MQPQLRVALVVDAPLLQQRLDARLGGRRHAAIDFASFGAEDEGVDVEALQSLPLAVPSLVLHLTFIVPVGGVRVTLSVTLPSDSSRAYFVLILPLASLKKARGPCFLPPEILARYFSSAAGSGAFC